MIGKVHLVIPFQLRSLRVRYYSAFEVDIVLLLKLSNKNEKFLSLAERELESNLYFCRVESPAKSESEAGFV